MNRSVLKALAAGAALVLLPGCLAVNQMLGRAPKPEQPRMLILPFSCDDAELGATITQGFTKEITSKVDLLDPASFQLYLATHSARAQALPGFASLPGVPALSSGPAPSGQPQALSASDLLSGLPQSAEARRRLYKDGGVAYLAAGEAREQVWSELESGYIKTAATASVRVWDLETDELLSEEIFKQGSFEIVAPDRIGAKLADRVNRRLREVRQQNALRAEKTFH